MKIEERIDQCIKLGLIEEDNEQLLAPTDKFIEIQKKYLVELIKRKIPNDLLIGSSVMLTVLDMCGGSLLRPEVEAFTEICQKVFEETVLKP